MKLKRQCLVLLVAVGLGLSSCATSDLPDEIKLKDFTLKQYDISLKSGLRILVQEDHSAPVVVVTAVYGVGGTGDPPGVEGLAHFVEHLAFRARMFDGPQIWDTLKRIGASFNASTAADVTSYYSVAHKDELATLTDIEGWRLLDTTGGVTEEVFKTEREVVRNELRQRRETTIGNKVFDLVLEALFPKGHPLARPLAGTHESLSAATLQHARDFAKKYYRPENCTIVIAGDVTSDQVKKEVGRWPNQLHYGPEGKDGKAVPHNPLVASTPAPAVPDPPSKEMKRHKGPVAQPQLLVAWSMPGAHRGNNTLISFAGNTLAGALAAGLQVDEDDDIESFGAGPLPLNDASVMLVQMNLKPGADPEKARARVLDSLSNAWTTPDTISVDVGSGLHARALDVTPVLHQSGDSLQRFQVKIAKWYTGAALFLGSDNLVGRALAVGEHLHATGDSKYYKSSFEELSAFQSRNVIDFAYKWLTRERAVAVFIEPEHSDVPRVMQAGAGAAVGITKRASHDVGQGETEGAADIGSARILEIARPPGIEKFERFALPNGLQMVIARSGIAPIAHVSLNLRGGDAIVKPQGMASLARSFSRKTCNDHGNLDAMGGRIYGGTGATSAEIAVDISSGNLSNGIAVLSDYVACIDAQDDYGRFDDIIKRRQNSFDRLANRPESIAGRTLWRELYPGHPYGVPSVDPSTLKDVKLEQMSAYIKEQFRPQNAVAVVVGDIDAAEVRSLSTKYLGRWQGAGGRIPVAPATPAAGPEGRKVFVIDRPKATQAVIQIGCRLPAVTAETLPIFDLARALLNEETWALREQWGATYGVSAGIQWLPGGASHMLMGGAVENAQVGASLLKLLGIIERMGTGAFHQKTFLLKRWDVARDFSRRFSDGSSLADGILHLVDHGLPPDTWDRYPQHLAAARRDQVKNAMSPCVDNEVVTVVGDAQVLRGQISGAGLPLQE